MECECSPDVSDCPRCHPEMWIRNSGGPWSWTPKFCCSKILKNNKKTRRSLRRKAMTRKHK